MEAGGFSGDVNLSGSRTLHPFHRRGWTFHRRRWGSPAAAGPTRPGPRARLVSVTLEDRGSEHPSIAKPAPLLLQEPEPPSRENLRSQRWIDVDEPDAPRVAIDRINDASQHRGQRLVAEGMEEVTDREIVRDREFGCVGDHDLDVLASVLMSPRRQTGASDLRQDGGDVNADDLAEWPSCGLMDNSPLSASEVHERVAIADPEVMKRAGEHMPGRGRVALSTSEVLGLIGQARSVQFPIQHAIRQPR